MTTTTRFVSYFLLAVSLAMGSLALRGQELGLGIPEVINFSREVYQGGTQNWSIATDTSGLVYFGNNKGVLTHDGTYWNRLALPNKTIVRSLRADANNRIWVGGQDELGYLSRDLIDGLRYESLVHLIPAAAQSFEDVWSIATWEGQVYFSTNSALFIYDGEEMGVIAPSSGGRFSNLFSVAEQLFIEDTEAGLLTWDGEALRTIKGGAALRDFWIAGILPHVEEQLLIVTETAGLFLFKDNEIRPWTTASTRFLRENQAYCAVQLSNGNYAIGTVQNGLLFLNAAGEPLAHYNKASGLQNNSVLTITIDSYDNLWLGLDNGIAYLKQGTPLRSVEDDSGISGTGYCAAVVGDQLLLGTNQGLYTVEWPINPEPFRPKALATRTSLKTQIWNFSSIGDDVLISTHDGAYRWAGGELVSISPRHGSWRFLPLANHPDYLLEGGYDGLYLYQKRNDEWVYQRHLAGFEESARVLAQDARGEVWVSHAYKGLYRIRLNEELAIAEVRFYDTEDGLPTNININVVKIQEELFFTTPAGVYRYAPETDRFVLAPRMEQLLGERANIRRLMEQGSERLWFVLEEELGFLQIAPDALLTDQLVEKHYLNVLEKKVVAGFERVFTLDEANTLIATEDGFLNYCHPCLAERTLPFQVLIRRVDAFAQGQENATQPIVPTLAPDSTLRLPTETSSLRFTYAAPFFEDVSGLSYRYRLRGLQEQWSTWSPRTEKEYNLLPYGQYTFEVEAKNTYGQVSQVARQRLQIATPWYATSIAKLCYLLLGIATIWLVFRWTTQRAVQEREQVIEAQAA
ncbi:MAG: triple tyrosine motif-containing protein, partial [Bacteroidota bacterium]